AQIVPDAATERPRRLHGTQADRRGPDGNGRVRPRTARAGRIVPVPLRLEILHGGAPRDAHGEGPLRAPRDRLERGDSGHVARQTDRGDQEPPVAGPVEAPDGRAERAALRTGPRHRGPRMVQEDWRPAYGSFPQPTGPERGPHRRPGRVRGGPSPACPPAGRGRDAPDLGRPSEIPPQAPLRERGLGRREDGLRGRRTPDVPEGRWSANRRREPGLDRGPQRDRRGHGHVGGTHLERFRGGPTPSARVRRRRGDPPVSGDVMGHDPWADLREQAERIRHSIESSLGVTRPGILQEAPEDRGLFALAAHGWAAELKASPASIATRAARVPVVPPYRALTADGPYVNFSVEP